MVILLLGIRKGTQSLAEDGGNSLQVRCFIDRKSNCHKWETDQIQCLLFEQDLERPTFSQVRIEAQDTVRIRTEHFPPPQICSWNYSTESTIYSENNTEGIYSVVISQVSERDSGIMNLCCESGGRYFCVAFAISLTFESRPSTPQLKILPGGRGRSKFYVCSSEGFPLPKISWTPKPSGKILSSVQGNTSVSTASSFTLYNKDVLCCAENSLGKECSRLHSYGLWLADSTEEVNLITLTPGQSLLLRCIDKQSSTTGLHWSPLKKGIQVFHDDMGSELLSYLFIDSVNVEHNGSYTCRSHDNRTKSTHVQVLEDGFIHLLELNEVNSILAQDRAKFCFRAVLSAHPKPRCHWITPNGKFPCSERSTFSGRSTFELCDPAPGHYQFRVESSKACIIRNLSLCVTDTPSVSLVQESDKYRCSINSTRPLKITWMTCPPSANCLDAAAWKDVAGLSLQASTSEGLCQTEESDFFPLADFEHQTTLKCCVHNAAGKHCSQEASLLKYYYTATSQPLTGLLGIVLLLVTATLIVCLRRKKPKYESQFQILKMVDSDYVYIDFKQFQYDQSWEFPRENLELGKELGSGAFGKVLEATAYGICKSGVSEQVAVKMLKEEHEAGEKEALMSELKMMMHIGNHDNIVNLLGACTGTGPTYLIFQYCAKGDLLNYLKTNRERFHQSLTDLFTKNHVSCLYHNFQSQGTNSPSVPMYPASTRQPETLGLLNRSTSQDPDEDHRDGMHDGMDSAYDDELQVLTYDDLLSFSYQVAKGMEYLSSRNCIHRDLAARNVLVTLDKTVKIGDFGLSRDIEKDSNYVIRGNVRLPVKWMAPESLFQGVYTMESDVWSYGILLWEIFSLGVTPYPGMKVDQNFCTLIENGFQMDRPYYASGLVYQVMRLCWAQEPHARPPFSKLVTFMEAELEDLEEKLYANITESSPGTYKNVLLTHSSM